MNENETTLALDSASGNAIDNGQISEISYFEKAYFKDLEKKWGNHHGERCSPTPRYNCHGLTFASRRTGIFDSQTVRQILREDGYIEVSPANLMLGDVIVYFAEDGDVEHSGLVVELPGILGVPKVCSKWGKYSELIHWANQCPYSFAQAKYYRFSLNEYAGSTIPS